MEIYELGRNIRILRSIFILIRLAVTLATQPLLKVRRALAISVPLVKTAVPDALLEEIKHFVDCIYTGNSPDVSGEAGRRALATAIEITDLLQ
jgi:predicted dehydrogenase